MKILKKSISVLMVLVMLFSMLGIFSLNAFASADVKLNMSMGDIDADGYFTLTVTAPVNSGISGSSMSLRYNSSYVECVSYSSDTTFYQFDVNESRVAIAWMQTSVLTAETVIMRVVFKTVAGACGETVFTLVDSETIGEGIEKVSVETNPVYLALGISSIALKSTNSFLDNGPRVIATFANGQISEIHDFTSRVIIGAGVPGIQRLYITPRNCEQRLFGVIAYIRGDADGNGTLDNAVDYQLVRDVAITHSGVTDVTQQFCYDVNEDGVVDAFDMYAVDRLTKGFTAP